MNAPRQNILVIKLGALGDFIQSLGPMAAIRKHHSDAHITLLTTKPFVEFAKASGYCDEILLDPRPKLTDVKSWLYLFGALNEGNFTRVYDLQNNDRTGFYLKLFSKKPEWVGVARGASHRNTSKDRTKGLAFYGHAQTLGLAGIKDVKIDTLEWVKGRDNFEGLKPLYVLIASGSAPDHPEKRWPAKHYITLCKTLVDHGYQPVLIGTEAERDAVDQIEIAVPESLNLCGKTSLFDVATLAQNAVGAVGNDTGPMHIIAPTGCKTLVLFSANTNPKRHSPLGDNVVTMQVDDLEYLLPQHVWEKFEAQHMLL